ncbi:MAG: DNA translocase FtsK [Ruminococcaceae bacterium]|nr:DNA translocase FtsK [Oscillospiraceae bacterium]
MANKKTPKKNSMAKKVVKSAGKGAAKSAVRTVAKESGIKTPKRRKKSGASVLVYIIPYVLILLALILAICFVTVHLLDLSDGVGVVGYAIQAFFCALFGPSAFLLPLILGYIGVRWCIFNAKWSNNSTSDDYYDEKKDLVLITVMSSLILLMLSTLIGIFAGQDTFDTLDFWEMGIAGEGGGILGGMLAFLLIICFKEIISSIIVIFLIVVFAILAVGLTPNKIINMIREKNEQRAERKENERLAAENEDDDDEDDGKVAAVPFIKNRKEIREAPAPKEDKTKGTVSVDELLDDDIAPTPVDPKVANKLTPEPEVHIGPAEREGDVGSKSKAAQPQSDMPLDFGGDPSFDKGEFNSIDDIVKGLSVAVAAEAAQNKRVPDPAELIDEQPEEPEQKPLDLKKIESDDILGDTAAVAPDETAIEPEPEIITPYVFPPYDLLAENKDTVENDYSEELQSNARILVDTLKSFKVGIKEVTYSRGPTITRYELKPEVGTRVRSIANLVDDIALNLATTGVRIEAPIPNKAAVGIEVPNKTRATVYLRDLIENQKFFEAKSRLTASLGMDVGGNPIYFDISKMPHLLIAGTTGSGKSICINCIIISILYKAKPEDVKLILIDPKKVEFNMYKNIPHLYCPIVSEPKKAAGALASAVAEMERRFELIESVGVRDIASYNAVTENDPEKEYMPHMVIIIDELADLMMTARDEVETSICRLAQKARAAGIHVILGTQRPSVDVITGLIKANVPSRIACTVTSQVDSRTIIDVAGAENLIGRGDMLFSPVGSSKPVRVQGAFVSDGEVEKIVNFISENNGKAKYNEEFMHHIEEEAAKCGMGKKGAAQANVEDMPEVEGGDTKFRDAVKLAIESGKISTSFMQRRLSVGYGRAAKIIDTMEALGYVSAPDGNKPRQVLITMDEYMRRVMDGNLGSDE